MSQINQINNNQILRTKNSVHLNSQLKNTLSQVFHFFFLMIPSFIVSTNAFFSNYKQLDVIFLLTNYPFSKTWFWIKHIAVIIFLFSLHSTAPQIYHYFEMQYKHQKIKKKKHNDYLSYLTLILIYHYFSFFFLNLGVVT